MSVPPKKYRCTGCEKSLNENNRCPNRVASFSTEQISKTVLKFLNRGQIPVPVQFPVKEKNNEY